ncbi:MAG: CDP-alcohol phosphatidyltransferase family protein [Micropruina sp.]
MTAAQPQFALGSGARTPLGWRDPVRRFGGLAVAGVVTMVVAAVALGLPMVAVAGPAGVLTVALVGCAIGLRRTHPHPRLGTANAITLLRLAIVGLLLSILFGGGVSAAIIIALSVVALSLDGLDGHLARRQRLTSRFGAAFDMEVDSAFALVLSVLAAFGPAGPLVLLLGLPRYLLGVAGLALPWLNGTLPARYSRKVVCVVQLVVLIVLQLPGLATWFALTLVVAVAGLLAWSFGIDVVHLFRTRTRSAG